MVLVIERLETLARHQLKLLRFPVMVASEVDVPYVVLDFCRSAYVVVSQQHIARVQPAGDRFVVTTEKRQPVEFDDLRRGGSVRLTKRDEESFGFFQ